MTEIIYFRESALESVISDIGSFTTLGIFLYANHNYFGDHVIIAILLLIVWLSTVVVSANKKRKVFTSKEELKKYVNKTI